MGGLLERKGLELVKEPAIAAPGWAELGLVQVLTEVAVGPGPRRRAKGVDEPIAGMIGVLRIGRRVLEGTAHVESSLLQGSGQARRPPGSPSVTRWATCPSVSRPRTVLLNRERL